MFCFSLASVYFSCFSRTLLFSCIILRERNDRTGSTVAAKSDLSDSFRENEMTNGVVFLMEISKSDFSQSIIRKNNHSTVSPNLTCLTSCKDSAYVNQLVQLPLSWVTCCEDSAYGHTQAYEPNFPLQFLPWAGAICGQLSRKEGKEVDDPKNLPQQIAALLHAVTPQNPLGRIATTGTTTGTTTTDNTGYNNNNNNVYNNNDNGYNNNDNGYNNNIQNNHNNNNANQPSFETRCTKLRTKQPVTNRAMFFWLVC